MTSVILAEVFRITQELQDEDPFLWIVAIKAGEIVKKPCFMSLSIRLQPLVHLCLMSYCCGLIWTHPLLDEITRTLHADDFKRCDYAVILPLPSDRPRQSRLGRSARAVAGIA